MHKDLQNLNQEQLIEHIRELQLRISRFSAVEQSLINVRDRLDSEIVMHKRMNSFNKEAFEVADITDFLTLASESIIDIFEFEFGMVIVSDQSSQFDLNYSVEGINLSEEEVFQAYNLLNVNLNYYESGKVLKLNNGQWDDLERTIPFHQVMLTKAHNPEFNISIYFLGGVLKTGALSYNAVDDKRLNAFGLFAQQVLSQFNNLLKAKRIQTSENRLSRLANVFLGFGSIPIDNISKLTDLACELLKADFCFYKELDTVDLFAYSYAEKNDIKVVLDLNDIVFLKSFIRNSNDETYIDSHLPPEFTAKLRNQGSQINQFRTIGRKVNLEGKVTGILGVCFASAVQPTDEDKQIIGIIAAAIAVEEKRHIAQRELITNNAELKKINAELDNFVYSVSHDLRAPLLAMKGLLGLINFKSNDQVENEEYVHMISDSVVRMDETIKEILDYSRNARLGVRNEFINIKEITSNAFNDVKFYSDHNVDLILEIDKNFQLYTDKPRLNTVIKNMIANAVKYSRKEIANSYVKVKANKSLEGVSIRIEDNGEGISESNLSKVFNMFYRASSHTSGTGLGLYICREIITKLGGKIEASSVVGKGSVFTIYIPQSREIPNNEMDVFKSKDLVF
ncbi:MAG: sensor histidine kinase [Bacteroidia bacterium]